VLRAEFLILPSIKHWQIQHTCCEHSLGSAEPVQVFSISLSPYVTLPQVTWLFLEPWGLDAGPRTCCGRREAKPELKTLSSSFSTRSSKMQCHRVCIWSQVTGHRSAFARTLFLPSQLVNTLASGHHPCQEGRLRPACAVRPRS
jgi:hypothetical protein